MKTTFTILVLALTASVLPSYADPTDAATHATFQFGQLTVAFPQSNPGTEMECSSDGALTYCTKTRVVTYAGNAKLVVTAPGQKPVTISGENLTVTFNK